MSFTIQQEVCVLSSKTVEGRHFAGEVPLGDYFSSDEAFAKGLAAMRRKVVGVFIAARCPRTGRSTGRDNYLIGIEGEINPLVRYVCERITTVERVFGYNDLPEEISSLNKSQRKKVLCRIHQEMVKEVLLDMRRSHNLWYQESEGIWMFTSQVRAEGGRSSKEPKQA